MNHSRVAIITRTLNRPLLLPRALNSVLQQDYAAKIWCVVNDGGDPDPVENCVQKAREAGLDVSVVHREHSGGMEAASNAGIELTDTDYVVLHDDDDTWKAGFLVRTVGFLDSHPEYLGVVSKTERVMELIKGDQIEEISVEPFNHPLQAVDIPSMAMRNQFPPISHLFRRSIYNELGGFDETLPVLGDWDFNLRLLLRGDIGVIPEVMARQHCRESLAKDQGEYGNTVTSGVSKHIAWEAIYRNRMLRDDLASGKAGLGHILTQGKQSHILLEELEKLRISGDGWRALERLSRRIGLRKMFSR